MSERCLLVVAGRVLELPSVATYLAGLADPGALADVDDRPDRA